MSECVSVVWDGECVLALANMLSGELGCVGGIGELKGGCIDNFWNR